ncbi:CopD family protein [Serratia marcescens]|uniref:CopD family protein n=1 Tax=Serratia marcescens TaxID=615 RepID=UPI00387A43AF
MTLATLFVLCRLVHFAAVMLMFGISLFTALLSPQRLSPILSRDVRPLLLAGTWAAGLSAVALLAIQAGQMGDGWQDAWRLEIWWAVLGTTFGEVWRWHLGLSLLAILSLLLPERPRAQALALCSALLLVSLAFIGHAAMHEGTLGALHRANHEVKRPTTENDQAVDDAGDDHRRHRQVPPARETDQRGDGVAAPLRRLQVAQANQQRHQAAEPVTGGQQVYLSSPYQRLLLIKTALVALMVMVALANRYAIVPAMSRVPALAQRGVVLACWLEVGLGMAVLLLVSLFATYAPV